MLSTNFPSGDRAVRTDEEAAHPVLSADTIDRGNWNGYPELTDTYNIDTDSMSEFTSGGEHYERYSLIASSKLRRKATGCMVAIEGVGLRPL